MSYALLDPQPAARDSTLAFDAVAPGLYPGETAFVLAGGEFTALSVDTKWLDNGAGVTFTAYARHIIADGTTILDSLGQQIETSFSHTADPGTILSYGVDVIAREMMYALMGLPLTTQNVGGVDVPLFDWHGDVLNNVNITTQAQFASVSGVGIVNPGNILGTPTDTTVYLQAEDGTVLQTELGADITL